MIGSRQELKETMEEDTELEEEAMELVGEEADMEHKITSTVPTATLTSSLNPTKITTTKSTALQTNYSITKVGSLV